jgi:hypothetical protein
VQDVAQLSTAPDHGPQKWLKAQGVKQEALRGRKNESLEHCKGV